MTPWVLVVEDEEDIRELIEYNLLKEGFKVTGVGSGEAALEAASGDAVDLVLLDLMLPGMDGFGVCQALRKNPSTQSTPVVILTAKGDEADIVRGLNLGADDYITKPFSPKVLIARVQAVLRRAPSRKAETSQQQSDVLQAGHLTIHWGRREVAVDGAPVEELTATEFRVLAFLARRPGWVFTRQQILDAVHGDHYVITDRAVDVQIVGLRKKLGAAGDSIQTVRGVGYRFKE